METKDCSRNNYTREKDLKKKKIIIKIEDEGRGEPHKLIEYTRTMSTIMILIII